MFSDSLPDGPQLHDPDPAWVPVTATMDLLTDTRLSITLPALNMLPADLASSFTVTWKVFKQSNNYEMKNVNIWAFSTDEFYIDHDPSRFHKRHFRH